MNVISWERLWIYYEQASSDIREDILKRLELGDFLPRLAVNVRKEVMKYAPDDVIMVYGSIPLTKVEEMYQFELAKLFGLKR